jgi:hypothetical protein
MSLVLSRGLVMWIFILSLCGLAAVRQKMLWQGVVKPEAINVYQSASTNERVTATLHQGDAVDVVLQVSVSKSEWCRVTRAGTSEPLGFVLCLNLELGGSSPEQVAHAQQIASQSHAQAPPQMPTNSPAVTESFATPFQLEQAIVESSVTDAIPRLAMVTRQIGIIECNYSSAMKSMKLKKSKKEESTRRDNVVSINEAGDFRNVGGHTVAVDDDKASKGDLDHVTKQIDAHNKMRDKLKDLDFQKNGAGWSPDGETHVKDAGNGYHVRVSLAGGKASTTLHRNGGPMVKAVGTTKNADTMGNHIDAAMSSAASQPEVNGYST